MSDQDVSIPYAGPLMDAVALFESLKLGYALIGGVAAMYYGRSRFTEDVDFVVTAGHMDVLAKHPEAMKAHHFDPTCTYKLYHESGVSIDIWKDEHADAIVSRARTAVLKGRGVRVADPHDLVAMKLRSGRLKDDYDISEIAGGVELEDSRLRSLVGGEEWGRYQEIRRRMRGQRC